MQASDVTLTWGDSHLLGYTPMDEIHEEFVQLVGKMQEAADEQLPELLEDSELPSLLQAMQTHLQHHFAEEDQWMLSTGFPPRDCHIDEHSAVLKSVGEVKALLGMGNAQVCRDLVTALADWFPGHATHLDSALAHWMCKRSLGGKPVVLRRMNHEELHGTD